MDTPAMLFDPLYCAEVSSTTVFFFVNYMHIHAPFIMYCSRLFFAVFLEINCLHTFKHAYVRRVTELHLSTKFHVICLCEREGEEEFCN